MKEKQRQEYYEQMSWHAVEITDYFCLCLNKNAKTFMHSRWSILQM